MEGKETNVNEYLVLGGDKAKLVMEAAETFAKAVGDNYLIVTSVPIVGTADKRLGTVAWSVESASHMSTIIKSLVTQSEGTPCGDMLMGSHLCLIQKNGLLARLKVAFGIVFKGF